MNNGTRLALAGIIAIALASIIGSHWAQVDSTNVALTGLGALGGYIGSEVKHALTDKIPDKPNLS